MSVKEKFIDLILRGKDLFSPTANAAGEELKKLQAESKATSEEMRKLEQAQAQVAKAQGLELYAQQAATSLAAAKEEVSKLSREIDESNNAVKRQNEAFKLANTEVKAAEKAAAATARELNNLNKQFTASKAPTQQQSDALKQAATAAQAAETALAEARAEVTRLAQEMSASDRPTKEQNEALKLASRSANQLQTEYNKLQLQLGQTKTQLEQNGVDTKDLASEQDRLQREVKESANALNEKRDRLRELRTDMDTTEKSTGKFGEGLRGLTTRLVSFAAAYVGINQLRNAIFSIFDTGDKFERLEIQLASIMGSIEGGEQASEWIKEFTKNTPLQLEQVSQAFVRLKAFGLDPMDGTLQGIVDQAFQLGGSFEEVEGISLALGQAWAKQKLQGEEINQLIERGVPVWRLLEEATGKNTAELQRLSSAGLLGRDVIKQLMEEMARSAEGSAAAAMKALSGLISNAKDNLTQFYNLIATSGAIDWLKQQLESINKTFAEMSESGELKKLAKNISDGIVATAQAVKSLVTTVYEWRGAIAAVGAVWATLKVGRFLSDLVKGVGQAITSLITLVTTKKAAAAANIYYTSTFGPLVAAIGTARAAMTAWMASLTGVGGLLAKGGIFAGIGYGIYEISRLALAFLNLRDAQRELSKSQGEASITNSQVNEELRAINDQLNSNYTTLKEVIAAEEAGQIIRDQSTGIWRKNTEEIDRNTQTLIGHGYALTNSVNAMEEAYKSLGIQSTQSLQNAATAAEQAYLVISSGNEPIEQQRAAFLKYAEATVKASAATGASVPETLKAQAATLGLSDSLDKLTNSGKKVEQSAANQNKALSGTQSEIANTQKQIEDYRKTLDSSTASSDEKAAAAEKLTDAEAKLAQQTQRLNEIKEVEAATYTKLKGKLAEYTQQMEALDALYKADGISAQEYIQQRERYAEVIGIIQRMLAGLGDGEQELQEQTENANISLADQQRRLDDLAQSSGQATRYISLLASAQQALKTEFDLTDKSTEDLSARINELNGFIVQNNRVTNIWWTDLARASNAAFTRERNIINETLLMRKLTEQLGSATLTLRQLDNITAQTDRSFKELSENDMKVLRQAITDAEARLLSFRDELAGTVSSLQDELDRLNNNQAAIEKRRYEQQTAELREKLKAAEASGDRAAVDAAREALKLAEQIYKIKQQQAAEDTKAQRQQSNQAAPVRNTTATSTQTPSTVAPIALPPSSNTGSSRTVRLVLDLQGRSFSAEMAGNEADRLLAQIERARSTSI